MYNLCTGARAMIVHYSLAMFGFFVFKFLILNGFCFLFWRGTALDEVGGQAAWRHGCAETSPLQPRAILCELLFKTNPSCSTSWWRSSRSSG